MKAFFCSCLLAGFVAQAYGNFGFHTDVSGTDVIVSGHAYPGPGKAYVFEYFSGSMIERATFDPADGEPGDGFGNSVAISGDYAAVGAPYMNNAIPDSHNGSVYLYHREGNDWSWVQKLESPLPGAGDTSAGA